jgi:hypothetical protein
MGHQVLDQRCKAIQDTSLSQRCVAIQTVLEAAASDLRTTFGGDTGAMVSGGFPRLMAGTWAPEPPSR